MKMNKNKEHWRVTFNCNMDARNNCTLDVWASTIRKAEKHAIEIMQKRADISFFSCTSIELCKD